MTAYGTTSTATGQLTQISLRDTVGSTEYYKKILAYNTVGLVETETVAYPLISSTAQYDTVYTYKTVAGRLASTHYPDDGVTNGEIVTYAYNGMGLMKSVTSSVHGIIVDEVGYNELGRINAMRYAVGADLFLRQKSYPWVSGTSSDSNARLRYIHVGTTNDGSAHETNRLELDYNYDSFGNIEAITEGYNNATSTTRTFSYDTFNRLHRSYAPDGSVEMLYQTKEDGRPSTYEGQTNNYNSIQPYAVDSISVAGNTLAYTRDANGNAIAREFINNGSKLSQVFVWNEANQLQEMKRNGVTVEHYWYDTNGIRVRKTRHGVNTLYPFAHYEVEGGTPTRYYLLNGQPVALRTGSGSITYLHRDQVDSVALTTVNGAVSQQRQYFPYGNKRGGADFAFEFNYTGQRLDETGLLYYNARYYDPKLGQFISPDTIIPDPTDYFSYNRYLYGRGNPVSNNDPSGHDPCSVNGDWGNCVPSPAQDKALRSEWQTEADNGITYNLFLQGKAQYEIYKLKIDSYTLDLFLQETGNVEARDRLINASLYTQYYLEPGLSLEGALLQDELYVREGLFAVADINLSELGGGAAPIAMMAMMSLDQRALKDLVYEASNGARKALTKEEAEIVLDWAQEYNYPGWRASAEDVSVNNNHWVGGPHVHLPGVSRHVPVEPGVKPR